MTTKKETGYTIKRDGELYVFYTAKQRKEAINSLLYNVFYEYTWKELKKMGYSVVKVTVKEVKK